MTEPALQIDEPTPASEPKGCCRYGVPNDRPHFVRLWREHLVEMHEQGSALLPNEHNLYLFWDYFDAYTTGRLDGVVILWSPAPDDEPVGVAMAGDAYSIASWQFSHVDERWGRLWGVYLQPPYRGSCVGLQMELFGEVRLLEQGFHRLTTTVRVDNPFGQANWRQLDEARGAKAVEIVVVGQLGRKTVHR